MAKVTRKLKTKPVNAIPSPMVMCALCLMTACGVAQAGDPVIAPGLWSYHADIHYHAGAMAAGTLHKDWQVCVKAGDTRLPTAMPPTPGVQCDNPTLRIVGKALHTAMSCTAEASNGFVSKIVDDFVITPASDKRKVTIDGTVHQTTTGGPVSLPSAVMTLHTTGVRTGGCTETR